MSGLPVPNYASTFPLLPLRGAVVFPGSTVPFEIGRPKTIALVEHVLAENLPYVVVFPQRVADTADPGQADLYELGTLARVVGIEKQRKGNYVVVLEGLARVRLVSLEPPTSFLVARVEPVEVAIVNDDELAALGMSLRDATRDLIQLLPDISREIVGRVEAIESPADLADFVATYIEATVEEKVELLATTEPKARVRKLLTLVSRRREVVRMRDKINSQVKDELGKTHAPPADEGHPVRAGRRGRRGDQRARRAREARRRSQALPRGGRGGEQAAQAPARNGPAIARGGDGAVVPRLDPRSALARDRHRRAGHRQGA